MGFMGIKNRILRRFQKYKIAFAVNSPKKLYSKALCLIKEEMIILK
jgi:hypothetical protein